MSSIMTCRQAAEFDHSLERNNWTAGDVKTLSSGDTLAKVLIYIKSGCPTIFITHLINLDTQPLDFIPEGLSVVEHQKGGMWEFNPAELALFLSPHQQNRSFIKGTDLQKELLNKKVLNANVLDYLLEHPELIPKEWKNKIVFFWGTIYRNSCGNLCVRYLLWNGDSWDWNYYCLNGGWSQNDLALVRA